MDGLVIEVCGHVQQFFSCNLTTRLDRV